jgi:uncharacterized membrane protein YheB (UPF0754 family)
MNISVKLAEGDNEELSKEIKNLLNQYFSSTQREVIKEIIDKKFQEKIEGLEKYIDSIFKDLAEKINNYASSQNLDKALSNAITKIINAEQNSITQKDIDLKILKAIEDKGDELPKNRIKSILEEIISENQCSIQIKFDK